MAPASYSSGSRTSRTAHPSAMRVGRALRVDLGDLGLGGLQQVPEAGHGENPSGMVGYRDRVGPAWCWLRIRWRRTSAGRIVPISPCRTASARPSISVGPPLTMTTLAPVCLARGTQYGGGVHRQRRADGEQQVALLADLHRPVDDLGDQRLAERDRVALEDPAAHLARRILLAGVDPRQRLGHRPAVLAVPAARPPDRAVDLDDELVGESGLLVQAVDVLGHDGVQLAPARAAPRSAS